MPCYKAIFSALTMGLLNLLSFVNATINIVTLNYVYNGPFDISADCVSLGPCTKIPGCSITNAFVRTVERNMLTANDHYCVRVAKDTSTSLNVSTVQLGTYEMFGGNPEICGSFFGTYGVYRENHEQESYLDLCPLHSYETNQRRYTTCSSMNHSEFVDSLTIFNDERVYQLVKSNLTRDFVGYTSFAQNCVSDCANVKISFSELGFEYNVPVCGSEVFLEYFQDDMICPVGYHSKFTNFPFTHFAYCTDGHDSTVPSRNMKDYFKFKKRFSIISRNRPIVSRELRYQRIGLSCLMLDDLRVFEDESGSYATSSVCLDLVYSSGYAGAAKHAENHVTCAPDGCTYSGIDFQVPLRLCRAKIRVNVREFLASTFAASFSEDGRFVGSVVYKVDFDRSKYISLSIYKDGEFYSFYPREHSFKHVTYKLIKPESEWYMKAMNFFAEDILKKMLKTLLSLLGSCVSELFNFLIDVGGCCFQQIVYCFLDMTIVLIVFLPCYNHLPVLLIFFFNVYTRLVVRDNCCFSAADSILSEL
nr:P60 protein [Ligustrum chlorotic spot virus]